MSAPVSIPRTRATAFLWLGPLFFVSGAIGLIYEVAWFRQLHLVLGVSVFAIGAVVSAFMLGLGFGSACAGGRMGALPRGGGGPLRFYALLEAGIGLWALLFTAVLRALEGVYVQLFPALTGHAIALTSVRFFLAALILIPPTFLMGATLPVLTRAVAIVTSRPVSGASWLYAMNTAGAVGGTVFAGFFALEHFGISGTLRIAMVLNFALAVIAWILPLQARKAEATNVGEVPRSSGGVLDTSEAASAKAPLDSRLPLSSSGTSLLQRWAYVIAAFTGFVSMAGQIVWTRALLFYIENSTYAFTAVLVVYLTGLAVGAAVGAAAAARRALAMRLLPWVLVAQTAASLVAILVYRNALALARPFLAEPLREGVSGLSGNYEVWTISDWTSALAAIFAQAGGVLLLPSLVFGFTFPIALAVAEARDDAVTTPRTTGRLYAANTFGSVAGTVFGTFAIIPLLGTPGSLLVLALLPAFLALITWQLRDRKPGFTAVRAGLALLFLLPLARVVAPLDFYRQMFYDRFGDVVWFHEGVSETVAICNRPDGTPWIRYSDGRGASGTVSYKGGWLYAHLPLLLHPDPESCLVICFGTGNTLGAASRHSLKKLDGVELSTSIIQGASIFRDTNHDIANNDEVNFVIDDGRNFLLGTKNLYDVISEEPPLIHSAGVVNLYTRDFYALCRERLTPDGIMAVWLPTWAMEELEVRMLVKAFLDVFPDATAWESLHPSEWILIGTKAPLRVDLEQLRARMSRRGIAEDLEKLELTEPEHLLSLYMNGPEYLRRFCGDVPPVTDDKSVVDFTLPREARANFGLGAEVDRDIRMAATNSEGLISSTKVRDFEKIYSWREPASHLVIDCGDAGTGSLCARIDHLQQERALDAARWATIHLCALAQDYYVSGEPETSFALLERNLEAYPPPANADIYAMKSLLLFRSGRIPDAERNLQTALQIDPENRIAGTVVAMKNAMGAEGR